MCVIFVADKNKRVPEEMVRLGFIANNSGAGAAWRNANGEVEWQKAMGLQEVQELNKTLPFPYVLHFRRPSPNTATGPLATQPFEVSHEASFLTRGVAANGVLFHNGFWPDWKNKLVESAIKGGWELPDGPYTDSRGLAIMASHLGGGFLELVDEKVIWFRKDFISIYGEYGGTRGWIEIDDILCSNDSWKPTTTSSGGGGHHMGFTQGSGATRTESHTTGSTKGTTSTDRKTEGTGGSPPLSTFHCAGASGEGGQGADQQEQVQGGNETPVREALAESRPEEGGKFILLDGEVLCTGCKNAVAKVHKHNHKGSQSYCVPCWFKQTGEVIRNGTYQPTEAVGVCQYCWALESRHVTVSGRKLVCKLCWIKQGRPSVEALQPDDPRCRATITR